MRKIIYSMMAFAAITFVSCGAAETADTTEASAPVIEGVYVLDAESTIVWKAKHNNDEDYVYSGTVAANGDVTVANGIIKEGLISFNMTTLDKEGDDEWSVKLEGHLKSADFFNIEMFPTLKFSVETCTENVIKGNFGFMGVNSWMEIPATIAFEGDKLTITGSAEVNFAELGTKYWSEFDALPAEEKATFANPIAPIEFNFTFTKTAAVQ
jgi:outer membrane protein assembly factor BamB